MAGKSKRKADFPLDKENKKRTFINNQIKRNFYTWITRHPPVFQSPISNDCLKVMLDDHLEPQLVPNFFLRLSVRELHNSLVSDPNNGGQKDARDKGGMTIISDSTLRVLLPPQLKQVYWWKH